MRLLKQQCSVNTSVMTASIWATQYHTASTHAATTYFFVSLVELEIEAGIQLRRILRGAAQYVDGAGDAWQEVRADANSLRHAVSWIVPELITLQHTHTPDCNHYHSPTSEFHNCCQHATSTYKPCRGSINTLQCSSTSSHYSGSIVC